MKVKDRYKILSFAKKQYTEDFCQFYQYKLLSKRALHNLLKQYKHSCMCEWSYCCFGLYRNCWQEPIEEGNWGLTQKEVDDYISYIIDSTAKFCRKDNRILYCDLGNRINVIIVMRDVCKTDFLITFTNEED